MALYVGLFYAKYFLQSSLSASAPANDLEFYYSMKEYSTHDKEVAEAALRSISRHLHYLTQELVVFAIFDDHLPSSQRNAISKKLAENPRPSSFQTGKPVEPLITMSEDNQPTLPDSVGPRSWLLFHLLGLEEKQKWLNVPMLLQLLGSFC
jgi:hypothetical protein